MKLTKSIQVRLTENEWKSLKKQYGNDVSNYFRQLYLKDIGEQHDKSIQ